MTITPHPTPADDVPVVKTRTRARYDWDSVVVGQWQRWIDSPAQTITDEDAMRACTRTRLAARWWAERNGLKVESRRKDHGRVLDLLFSPR